MDRRRLLLACAAAPLAVRAQETTITVGLADLRAAGRSAVSPEQGFQGALDVTFTNPRLRLVGDQGRLGGLFDLAARDRLFGNRWTGRLSLDAVPRWERQDRSVRLAQVRVQRFEVDEQGPRDPRADPAPGPGLAELALEDFSVWHPARGAAGHAGRDGHQAGRGEGDGARAGDPAAPTKR